MDFVVGVFAALIIIVIANTQAKEFIQDTLKLTRKKRQFEENEEN